MANEFNTPTESGVTGREFYFAPEEAGRYDEFEHAPYTETTVSKQSVSAKMKKMVYLLAACGSVASFGFATNVSKEPDAPKEPEVSIITEISIPEPEPDIKKSGICDSAFPTLVNLEPNGFLYNGEPLDEQYVIFKQDGILSSLVAGDVRRDLQDIHSDGDSSIYYDESTNTVYLNNANLEHLEANLMGNSFTVSVSGTCYLERLVAWGWYYGGSILITGDGTLYIGSGESSDYGILIEGEQSPSCLMVDRNVTLNVSGLHAAVLVKETTMTQAIYCLSELDPVLTRGELSPGYYTIFDEDKTPALKITFPGNAED